MQLSYALDLISFKTGVHALRHNRRLLITFSKSVITLRKNIVSSFTTFRSKIELKYDCGG